MIFDLRNLHLKCLKKDESLKKCEAAETSDGRNIACWYRFRITHSKWLNYHINLIQLPKYLSSTIMFSQLQFHFLYEKLNTYNNDLNTANLAAT